MRDHILNEIRRTAAENNGEPLGIRSFEAATGIRQSEWKGRFWARWSEAVADAGLQANKMQGSFDTDFLLKVYCLATRHFGKAPTRDELSMFCRQHEGYPEKTVYHRRFGGMGRLRGAARNWASQQNDFADVAHLLPEWKEPARTIEPAESVQEGLVYLLRSGAHYKIGRSDNVEKRIKQITIAMPEKVTLVHAIRTDDPPGIEAYWHRRFADRRANGEWFKLTGTDLKAFKRRKFQ
jgi:hypothetical protein